MSECNDLKLNLIVSLKLMQLLFFSPQNFYHISTLDQGETYFLTVQKLKKLFKD